MLDGFNERVRFDQVTEEYDEDSGRLSRSENSIIYAKAKYLPRRKSTYLRLYKGYLSTFVMRSGIPCRRARP